MVVSGRPDHDKSVEHTVYYGWILLNSKLLCRYSLNIEINDNIKTWLKFV